MASTPLPTLPSVRAMVRTACRGSAIGLIAFVLVAAMLRPAAAQWRGGWGGGFGWGNFASTAQQGAQMGLASVVRAEGYANLQNSEAAKNWEEAKSLDMQNRSQWTETYFEMRKTNKAERAAAAGPPITQEQAVRMAKMAAPSRLNATQLDPVTGHIEYPLILTADMYREYRSRLDSLFARRAASGGSIRYDDFVAIQDAVGQFTEALKAHISEYAAGDYGQARNFLESLVHEARMPGG
jgi:hypothetical protein